MELFIAGGVGEHGRNCFLVQGEARCFLVDCGKMADTPEDPYPRLTREQIGGLDAVFLTHSHADHTGALPWLYENGFRGTVIAATKTLSQLPFAVQKCHALEKLCPNGTGQLQSLSIQWGRSGHCVGSVWYRFAENGKSVFFSGDYTEDTQVYACDPIREQRVDLAMLDCAYGLDETPYYLFLGVFEAATIHYAVAKIFGPLLFGRGWCGYACWTAMVLDFLPYKQPQKPRKEKLGILRYVMFALSLALVSGLFLFKVANLEKNMFWLFLAGNALYYITGIALAFIFKDNRAFCKYLCPITVFLKPMSYFSVLRVHCDESKCVHCGKCLRVCPMNVEVNKESRKRRNGTECISSSWHKFYRTANSLVESGKLIAIYGQSSATEYAGVYSACVKLVKHISRDFCTNNRILTYHIGAVKDYAQKYLQTQLNAVSRQ